MHEFLHSLRDMYDGEGDRDATRAYPPRSIFRTAVAV
jgi:hypothetical protein